MSPAVLLPTLLSPAGLFSWLSLYCTLDLALHPHEVCAYIQREQKSQNLRLDSNLWCLRRCTHRGQMELTFLTSPCQMCSQLGLCSLSTPSKQLWSLFHLNSFLPQMIRGLAVLRVRSPAGQTMKHREGLCLPLPLGFSRY